LAKQSPICAIDAKTDTVTIIRFFRRGTGRERLNLQIAQLKGLSRLPKKFNAEDKDPK